MDVERSSLCNCVVNFLLEENYLLTAFELLHELLDDGRDVHAIRLKEFFSDSAQFPPDQISRFNVLRIADPQSLLEEKVAAEEKLAITEYELRLAQEDFNRLKDELHKINESLLNNSNESNGSVSVNHELNIQRRKKNGDCSDLGSLKDIERRDINCAVKEYLLLAGYRLTAMTFYEEVIDQNLDIWPNTPACVPDALRHYYYQYLSCTTEAAEEKISMHREIESLRLENEMLNQHKISLMKSKDVADGQIVALTKSLEHIQKDLKDKEKLVQGLRQSSEVQRKELNGCRAEITSLKMHIEGYRSAKSWASSDDQMKVQLVEKYEDEIKSLHKEIESLKARVFDSINSGDSENVSLLNEEKVVEIHEDRSARYQLVESSSAVIDNEDAPTDAIETFDDKSDKSEEVPLDTAINHSEVTGSSQLGQDVPQDNGGQLQAEDVRLPLVSHTSNAVRVPENTALGTVQILADALPKIVPYVLINHREELLPLIMCAIERHPDSSTRDSLTHTLFNLIKRPDEQQRQIIMEACVSLAKNVGEMRTETELLPQCWEQINHMYEERRLLVAQSCSQLALFVRPEIRDSLIFSIIQQLIEDSATVVREAAAHNLSLLLPLFPNADKYFKVEELMFQLMCDPSGVVVETALKELLPAVMSWGNKLDHILRVLLSHILGSAQRCPPLSGVEGSVESYLHVLGERERWNIDVLLRMLTGLLPFVHQQAINTCPFPSASESSGIMFSTSLLELYAGGHVEWPAFEWLHNDCFPDLIRLACLLPQKEDGLRNRITKLLLTVTEYFGDHYLTHMMLPLFLVAVGDDCSLTFSPAATHACIIGLKPKTAVAEKLANICVLPLLLAGVLGSPSKNEQLLEYLRKLLVQGPEREIQTAQILEVVNAVRFLCTYEQHHNMIFNVLWEMVVSSSITMKTNAVSLIKVIVPNIDAKVASTHVLPALVTLGSDQNLSVKYASIDAFGSVAQHFKNDMIVDKIRVQMDAFLEDGSHEATIAVVRALMVAAPHTTDRLRDYLVSKIYQITSVSVNASNVIRRRERANAFCEAIRALDATDLSTASVREFLLPSIQNLLKDPDAIDPAHKEALEIIMKERSGGTFEAISKVMGMGAHLGITSSVSSFFGEGGLLGKKDSTDTQPEPVSPNDVPLPPAEDTRFRRIMRGNFTDMLLRGKAKGQDENQQSQ